MLALEGQSLKYFREHVGYLHFVLRANFVSNLVAYLISVASQCIFSCLRLLL